MEKAQKMVDKAAKEGKVPYKSNLSAFRYSIDAELAKKTSDRVQTVEKKSVKETWDAIMEELKYGARAS